MWVVRGAMCKDDYTYSQILTVGGPGSAVSYAVECPFSGDEYEFSIINITTGQPAGTYQVTISTEQDVPVVPYDGTYALGSRASAPLSNLKALSYIAGPLTTLPPADTWVRVNNGSKYVYLKVTTPASSALFVAVQFRFLPVRVIPGRVLTVPDVAEHQYNIARADKVVERLEMDIQKGDEVEAGYGRLR